MPRSSAAEAARTKQTIVAVALDQAATEGLEGLTIGTLAARVNMSKPGVVGPFGSREDLQVAVLDEAVERFRATVVAEALRAEAGLARLRTVAEVWTHYLDHGPFAGGCFLTAAACELDGRPGILRDRIADALQRWERFLLHEVRTAVAQGELSADTVPAELVMAWNGLIMAANQQIQLFGRRGAGARARRLMLALLTA